MSDPQTLLPEIRAARRALEQGAKRIHELVTEFDGPQDKQTGEWQPGPKWRYADALLTAELAIREQYKDQRPPPASTVEGLADRKVKELDPALWADFHRLHGQIEATKLWLSAKKEAVSALQSELSTERALAR